MRFSLFKLFLAIGILAVAFAALAGRSYVWACVMVGLTALLFAAAAIRSLALNGSNRVSAIAFLAVGGSFLLIPVLFPSIQMYLGTNCLLAWAYRQFSQTDYSTLQYFEWSNDPVQANRGDFIGDIQNFFLIGRCAWSWLFAVLAGWIAGHMYSKRIASK